MKTEMGGNRANSAGKGCETQVASFLSQYGFQEIDGKELTDLKAMIKEGYEPVEALSLFGDAVFAQQVRGYQTIYGKPHSHDILGYSKKWFPEGLVIEVKWQSTGGSVDEKLPFVVLSLEEMPCTQSILIVDGGGMRQCALDWAISKNTPKFQTLSSVGAFSRWLRKKLT